MKFHKLQLCLLGILVMTASALAHKPLLSVDDNEDGTIYIEVGFSDGSSGSGHDLILKDNSGKVLSEYKVPSESFMDVPMPGVPYSVTFDAGPGHRVTVDGPFSEPVAAEETAAEPQGVEPAATAEKQPVAAPSPEGVSAPETVQPAPVMAQPAALQPLVVTTQAAGESVGPGFNMAFKMLLTTNIVIAVVLAFILVLLAFWLGYGIGSKRK